MDQLDASIESQSPILTTGSTELQYSDWFEKSALTQGSIIPTMQMFVEGVDPAPAASDGAQEPVFETIDASVVVLTQACDIPKAAQTTILVAEVLTYPELVKANSGYGSTRVKDSLAEGTQQALFLLPPSEVTSGEWSVVDFRSLFVVAKERVLAADSTTSLASPYREHLPQAFARFMMRVGLPSTLHEFKTYKLKTS
ncbi:hypothetical protein [Curtobacterium oceanosedimentum]|uniref:hypothetical protein n=1 Tax=Curtobacterium oceanosedimentum TaxID=465820 RepID=UPI00128EA196|nr:hypothetical protein [Curtobacterium oceanosedimentum]